MLDSDRSGSICRQEFVTGMRKLVCEETMGAILMMDTDRQMEIFII